MIVLLNRIQTELKANKGQYNSFGKYYYRSCEDILEAVKPLLKETGCALTISDELLQIGDRYYVKATATLHGPDGKNISNMAYAREEENKKGMDGSQVTGAASSYARKYALNGLFAIDDTKDSDATNTHGKGENTAPNSALLGRVKKLIQQKGSSAKDIVKAYNVTRLEELSEAQMNQVVNILEQR